LGHHADGKTLYSQPLGGNALYAYDLTVNGDTLRGRKVGVFDPRRERSRLPRHVRRPDGTCWCAITERTKEGEHWLHIVRYGKVTKPRST